MKNMLLTAFLFLLALPLWAQTPVVTPAPTAGVTLSLQPIDTRFSMFDGMVYTQSGYELRGYEDFKTVMDPIKDHETDRLIDGSMDKDGLGRLFKVAGFLVAAGGLTGILTDNKPSDQDTFLLVMVGGELTFDIGLLFGTDSQADKFNAVQRYNRFAYGREQVLPQTPMDEKSLLPVAAPTPMPTVVPVGAH